MTLIAGAVFLAISPVAARDYCEGNICYQNKAKMGCMKPEAKALMESVAAKFGQIEVTSVCDGRHAKHSRHYSGEAFDFRPMTSGKAQAIVQFLKASSEVGGVGTYRNGLIHADIGERKLAWGGGSGGSKRYALTKKVGRNSRYASLR